MGICRRGYLYEKLIRSQLHASIYRPGTDSLPVRPGFLCGKKTTKNLLWYYQKIYYGITKDPSVDRVFDRCYYYDTAKHTQELENGNVDY